MAAQASRVRAIAEDNVNVEAYEYKFDTADEVKSGRELCALQPYVTAAFDYVVGAAGTAPLNRALQHPWFFLVSAKHRVAALEDLSSMRTAAAAEAWDDARARHALASVDDAVQRYVQLYPRAAEAALRRPAAVSGAAADSGAGAAAAATADAETAADDLTFVRASLLKQHKLRAKVETAAKARMEAAGQVWDDARSHLSLDYSSAHAKFEESTVSQCLVDPALLPEDERGESAVDLAERAGRTLTAAERRRLLTKGQTSIAARRHVAGIAGTTELQLHRATAEDLQEAALKAGAAVDDGFADNVGYEPRARHMHTGVLPPGPAPPAFVPRPRAAAGAAGAACEAPQ